MLKEDLFPFFPLLCFFLSIRSERLELFLWLPRCSFLLRRDSLGLFSLKPRDKLAFFFTGTDFLFAFYDSAALQLPVACLFSWAHSGLHGPRVASKLPLPFSFSFFPLVTDTQ